METLYRCVGEVRRESSDSRRITGTALRYGDEAVVGAGVREVFRAGAFGDLTGVDAVLNLQHDRGRLLARTGGGGLTFEDGPESLRFAATLPETREADDTLTLIAAGVLRSVSVEFHPMRESRGADGSRIIERATLRGLGLVDRGAYPESVIDRSAGHTRRRFFL